MSSLFTDIYIGDHTVSRRTAEPSSSISMTCNILDFLHASPLTLFEGAPEDPTEKRRFFEDNFESFISCMIASDGSVRRLAVGVAERLFADETVLKAIRASKRLDSQQFKANFWKLT